MIALQNARGKVLYNWEEKVQRNFQVQQYISEKLYAIQRRNFIFSVVGFILFWIVNIVNYIRYAFYTHEAVSGTNFGWNIFFTFPLFIISILLSIVSLTETFVRWKRSKLSIITLILSISVLLLIMYHFYIVLRID